MGYNIKIKNKKSIKISNIIDSNKIPHMFIVTPSNPHDAKIMEELIINNNFSNNSINLVGDKEYINMIKNNYNIELIENDKKLLNERYIIENFFY